MSELDDHNANKNLKKQEAEVEYSTSNQGATSSADTAETTNSSFSAGLPQRRSYLSLMSSFVSSTIDTTASVSSALVESVVTGINDAAGVVYLAAESLQPEPIIRLRPTWNTQFGLAIKTLRIAAYTIGHDTSTIRLLTDHAIPTVILPRKVSYHKSTTIPGEWTYPTASNFQNTMNLHLPVPIILYFHGGAFCCCGSETHRGLIFRLVKATGAVVFAVDYRRPPEHPFPAPIMDCIEAYQYLLSNFVNPKRIVFAGDSAGGSLVASVSLKAHELGLPAPAAGVMLSPWVDLSDAGITDSWYRNEPFDYLPPPLARYFASQYMGKLTNDALASPMYSQQLHALPPLHVEVGECEVLHDQIVEFCEKIKAVGGSVDLCVRPDMVHVFCLFSFTGLSQCKDAFKSIAAFIKRQTAAGIAEEFVQSSVPDLHVPESPGMSELTPEEITTTEITTTATIGVPASKEIEPLKTIDIELEDEDFEAPKQ